MPITDLNDQQLQRALYLARHKLRIRMSIVAGLFILIVLTIFITATGYFSFFSRFGQLNQMMTGLWQSDYNWQELHQQYGPKDIELGRIYVFPRGNNTYDLAVEASNLNDRWVLAGVDYEFTANGQTVARGQGLLMPGERRLLTILGQKSEQPITGADAVNLFHYRWWHLEQAMQNQWAFKEEPHYQARRVIADSKGTTVVPAQVIWTVTNNTGENLLQSIWQIVLRSGGEVQYVGEYRDANFLAQADKTFHVAVFDSLSRVDQVAVYPMVNFFDPTNTYLPQVEPTFDRALPEGGRNR